MEDISNIFKEIAKTSINKKEKRALKNKKNFKRPPYTTERCNDQFVGILKIERKNARCSQWIESSLKDKKKRNTLHQKLKNREDLPIFVIVLESPHKDEYDMEVNDVTEPMPAMGDTGDNIQKFLPKYINKISATYENEETSKGIGYMDITSGIYRVLLINAIQYQCSLGEKTELYRNEIFSKMWKNETVKKDFRFRLKQNNVRIILNACTSGKTDNTIRFLVQSEIDLCNQENCVKLHSYHPCTWQECVGIEPEGWGY